MEGLFGEISAAASAMGMDGSGQGVNPAAAAFNPFAAEQQSMGGGGAGQQQPGGAEGRPSEQYSDEQLMKLYEKIQSGEMGPEATEMFNKLQAQQATGTTPDGKPIIDSEGGTTIQPRKGFVVKTKDVNTGGKMFINMTQHEHVDPFEQQATTEDQQSELGASEKGLRIPLSLGDIREESDKKGDPAQVIDVIWAPQTVEKAKKDPTFRQIVVELAFNYIAQKYQIELDLRYLVPKLSYKGGTVQYQRVRARKTPKIQEVELTQEQREEMERKNLEEFKLKEAMSEKKPAWQLYYSLDDDSEGDIMTREYWLKQIEEQFEQKVGDEDDRWSELRDSFTLPQTLGVFEEFDGLNHEGAKHMILVVGLPLMMRGAAVSMRVLDELFSLRVPNLYKLQLSFPVAIEHEDCLSFFDCKLRKMIIVAPVQEPKCQEIFEDDYEKHGIVDDSAPIPADKKKDDEQTREEEPSQPIVVQSASVEDDLLFDVM